MDAKEAARSKRDRMWYVVVGALLATKGDCPDVNRVVDDPLIRRVCGKVQDDLISAVRSANGARVWEALKALGVESGEEEETALQAISRTIDEHSRNDVRQRIRGECESLLIQFQGGNLDPIELIDKIRETVGGVE